MNDGYQVGYRKPPRHRSWAKGQSGNPRGRPKGSKNLATDLSEELGERVLVTEGGRQTKVSKQRAMVKSLTSKAMKGDVKAAQTIIGMINQGAESGGPKDAKPLSEDDRQILDVFRNDILRSRENDAPKAH